MSRRASIRFMQKEAMKSSGFTKLCKPTTFDGVNNCYRSPFAMHWRNFPDLNVIPIIHRHRKKMKRNQRAKEAMA